MRMMLTPAYDESGNRRPLYRLVEGDVVEWKRNGYTGFQMGRVTALCERSLDGNLNLKPIRIMPVDPATKGATGSRERWISKGSVMRVYERDGTTRKQMRLEDQPQDH